MLIYISHIFCSKFFLSTSMKSSDVPVISWERNALKEIITCFHSVKVLLIYPGTTNLVLACGLQPESMTFFQLSLKLLKVFGFKGFVEVQSRNVVLITSLSSGRRLSGLSTMSKKGDPALKQPSSSIHFSLFRNSMTTKADKDYSLILIWINIDQERMNWLEVVKGLLY